MLAWLPAALQGASPATRPVLTGIFLAASPQDFWLAAVSSQGSSGSTTIWQRDDLQKPWRPFAEISARIVGMAACNDRLAAALDDGTWQYVGLSTGAPLPQAAQLLQLASDGDTLYALGRIPVSPTTAAAQPATSPSPARTPPLSPGLAFFKLDRGEWQFLAALPAEVQKIAPEQLASGIINGTPSLVAAICQPSPLLQWWQLTDGAWTVHAPISLSAMPQHLRVFESGSRIAIWEASGQSLGAIHFPGRQHSLLELPGTADAADVSEIAGYIRVVYAAGDSLYVERYSPVTLTADGEPALVKLPGNGEEPDWVRWTQGAMLSLLLLVLLSTSLRGKERPMLKLDLKRVCIAPISHRVVAGLIDALPLLIGAGWIGSRYPDPQSLQLDDLLHDPALVVAGFIMGLSYVFYLVLCEMIFGRSIGKMLTGLRIVRFDGAPAGRWQLFVRNFFRLVDLWMAGLTLLLVILLPLRQRLGDIAAGTLVIKDLPPQTKEDAGA